MWRKHLAWWLCSSHHAPECLCLILRSSTWLHLLANEISDGLYIWVPATQWESGIQFMSVSVSPAMTCRYLVHSLFFFLCLSLSYSSPKLWRIFHGLHWLADRLILEIWGFCDLFTLWRYMIAMVHMIGSDIGSMIFSWEQKLQYDNIFWNPTNKIHLLNHSDHN